MSSYRIVHGLNAIQSTANLLGQSLVNLTKALNDVTGTTTVDLFMDAASGIGHRVRHGHSLNNLPQIYEKYGMQGVGDYFSHGVKDVMSPHGMPVPFAKEIADVTGMRTMTSVDWLSYNVGDVLAGGFSVLHSWHNFKLMGIAVDTGYMPPWQAASAGLGAVIKLGSGIMTTNPVAIVAGAVDLGVLVWSLQPALTMGKAYFVADRSVTFSAVLLAGVTGGGSAILATRLVRSGSGGRCIDCGGNRIDYWKVFFAGACGTITGLTVSVAWPDPIAVGSSAVAGYVLGERFYEIMSEVEWPNLSDVRSSVPRDDFIPDFLVEPYGYYQ